MILIVDDDPIVHLLYKRHLVQAGFELLSAKNGVEALALAEQTKPDLILMDVMMPEKDGFATLREFKKREATCNVPVIIMTANVAQYETCRHESARGGADGLLTKPLSPAKLVSEVQRFFPRP